MNTHRSDYVAVVTRHPKVTPAHETKKNINEQLVSSTGAWTDSKESLDLQPSSSKAKMIQSRTNRPTRSSAISIYTSDHVKSLSQRRFKDPNIDSTGTKNNRTKLLLTVFAAIMAVSVLAALAVGIYVLVRITATSTIANTTTTTTFTLRWQTAGTTVAGIGIPAGTALDRFSTPYSIAIDSFNALYVADYYNNRVQKFSTGTSIATTVAGQTSGTIGSTANDLYYPTSVLLDSSGNFYVSDSANHRVQFFANGSFTATTVAGTGSNGSSINELSSPRGLARNSISGALYIADYGNHRVMSYLSGVSTVVAGGNGSGVLNIQLNFPVGLAFDLSSNSLYIGNSASHNIVRWVLGASSWTLVAGSPAGAAGTISTMLYLPMGITLDSMGNVYVADYVNSRIQLFMSGKLNGITIAGTTAMAGSLSHLLYYPYAVALDSDFNLYVADAANQRIQKFLRY